LLWAISLAGAWGAVAGRADAQVGLQVGVAVSSNLVSDSFVTRFSVRPNPALALGVTGEARLDRYRVGASITVSRSDLIGREPQGNFTVTRLTIWHPGVYLRQPLRPWLSGEVRVGLVIYDPSLREGTLFRDGVPVQASLGLGLRVERRLGAVALGVAGQYDIHRFSTPQLRAQGYTGQSYVHRIAAYLSLRRVAVHDRQAR
jgi:hypothetical protein